MGCENLAIVFAPTLMRSPEANPMISLMSAQFEQKFVVLLITYYRDFFSKISSQQSVDQVQARLQETVRVVDHV